MPIPLIDLKRQYQTFAEEADPKILEVFHSAKYISGANVKGFEEEFAAYNDVKYAVSVGNGTDALVIALKALGIGEGDEVITTPFTFFATAEAISFVGAIPVFVDVEKDTYNMDPKLIEGVITEKTKAIMPVHIFGNPCKMDEINAIAKAHNLYVIEDAAQAAGAQYKGQMIGGLADIACFSFFPTKNLGGAGDGGMITTNDERLAIICRAIKSHGSGANGRRAYNLMHDIAEEVVEDSSVDTTVYDPLKYYNYLIGHNSRLDEVQAALLRVKLRYLDQWNDGRIARAHYYNAALADTPLVTPVHDPDVKHIYHMYILQSENREGIIGALKEKGIATGVYYPVPLHLQKVYTHLGLGEGSYPIAEYLSKRTFAIPMFAELTDEEAKSIVEVIEAFEHHG